jgi:2-polyprenyl-3-methyl-5-hydroxy-6-metoxy-1,4-benzoquinol methylase
MSATELVNAVQKLPPDELERFAEWFEQFIDNQWDARLASDIASGRLDAVAQKADQDFEAGRCQPL